jgi:sialate O-acetylesterase
MQPDKNEMGAILIDGPSDWQIIQRDAAGVGAFDLAGRWVSANGPGVVQVRLVREDTGVPVSAALEWQTVATRAEGTWSGRLSNIPAGGLYRLETRYQPDSQPMGEWSDRGDMRHFLGVGDLWVITGQSNSAGYGRGPVYDPPELGIHLFRNNGEWALATHPLNESTGTQHPVNRDQANTAHAPYIHFARLLKQQLHCPIGLIQTSRGGSALAEWNPHDPAPSAGLFDNMRACVAAAGGRVAGIVWYQGESEGGSLTGHTYLPRFAQAVAAWRAALAHPTLPVLTVQLNRHLILPTAELEQSWMQVREAQRQAARTIPHLSVVPSFDLPLSDGIHTSAAGNLVLAERLAHAALGLVYGRAQDYQAPDLQTARAAPDGQSITLSFAPVTSRMDNVDPTANCFRVEDAAGVAPVTAVTYPGGPNVRLSLGRALAGAAVVHGGWGLAPAAVPVDMERFMPMLGFYAAPVQAAA